MNADDRFAIVELVSRWSHAADGRDTEGLAALLVDDAQLEVGGEVIAGRDAVAARATAAPADHQLRRHVRNTVLAATGDGRAVAHSYYLLTASIDGGRPSTLATGVYVDEVARGADGWRIVRRAARPDTEGDITW